MANILVIDDDTMIRNMLRAGLEASGHQVREAASGEEAIVPEIDADLVPIDHYLDGMSGLDIASHYRKRISRLYLFHQSGSGMSRNRPLPSVPWTSSENPLTWNNW